jgi:hypothetical protein
MRVPAPQAIHGIGQRAISFLRPRGRVKAVTLGVGVVKDGVDLKAPDERVDVPAEGQEAHVDLLPRCTPGGPTTTEIVVTSSLTSPER